MEESYLDWSSDDESAELQCVRNRLSEAPPPPQDDPPSDTDDESVEDSQQSIQQNNGTKQPPNSVKTPPSSHSTDSLFDNDEVLATLDRRIQEHMDREPLLDSPSLHMSHATARSVGSTIPTSTTATSTAECMLSTNDPSNKNTKNKTPTKTRFPPHKDTRSNATRANARRGSFAQDDSSSLSSVSPSRPRGRRRCVQGNVDDDSGSSSGSSSDSESSTSSSDDPDQDEHEPVTKPVLVNLNKPITQPSSSSSLQLSKKDQPSKQQQSSPTVSSSSGEDLFACFSTQEMADIDRRVQLKREAVATATTVDSSRNTPITLDRVMAFSDSEDSKTSLSKVGELTAHPPAPHVPMRLERTHPPFYPHDNVGELSQTPGKAPTHKEPATSTTAATRKQQEEVYSTGVETFELSPLPHQGQEWVTPQDDLSHAKVSPPTAVQDADFDLAFGFTSSDDATPAVQTESSPQVQTEATPTFQVNGAESSPMNYGDNKYCHDNDNDDFDGREGIEPDERAPEIHPSFYAPPPYQTKQPPIVHSFSQANRPIASRKLLPVAQVFKTPLLRKIFKFDIFNQLQSEIANMLAYSDDSVVVSAPTGAGKTAVFEMAMARFWGVDMEQNFHYPPDQNQHTTFSRARKIVYISPSKALCEERYVDWSKRLSTMGLEVVVVTGDGDPSAAFRDVASAHLILTTPEKWDSLTRRWTESFFLFGSVKLFLVDECHLIAEDSRGCCLESLLCRMKAIQRGAQSIQVTQADIQVSSYTNTTPEAFNCPMRTVAVSATLPNIGEIASFLDANEAHTFDDSYRPVPLKTHVIGQGYVGEAGSNQFRFWAALDRNVPDIIHRFSKKKPALVFCHSKNDTEKLADLLAMEHGIGSRNTTNQNMATRTKISKLQRVLFHGIAYHHAGLEVDDRHLVEKLFMDGKIRVLCATSTLAMGVNLPAHLVVIKGTKCWRGGGAGYQDLDQASLLQMIGRAGRPGFDTSGTAVIMTDNKSKRIFERLASSGLRPAISKLRAKMDEVINTEISQKVITSRDSTMDWIKGTLFAIQLQSDPSLFGLGGQPPHVVEETLLSVCTDSIRRLQAVGAIADSDANQILALPPSLMMSQHLVDYQAMKLFVDLPHDAKQCHVLQTLADMEGLHRPVRRAEKRFLKEAHKSLKYKLDGPPSKVTIQTPSEKAFVLLQVTIGKLAVEDYALRQEMNSMVDYSSRMLAALEEYSVRGTKHGNVVLESLKLRRSLATCTWNAQEDVLNQIAGIGPSTALSLKFSGISKFRDVLEATDEQLEKAAKRLPPFGSNLRTAISKILADTLQLSGHIEFSRGVPSHVICELRKRPDSQSLAAANSTHATPQVTYTLVAYTDRPGGCIIYQRSVSSPGSFRARVPSKFASISIHLVASLVGLDEKIELEGNDKTRVSSKPPNAESLPAKSRTRRVRGGDKASQRKKAQKPTKAPFGKKQSQQAQRPPGSLHSSSIAGGIRASCTSTSAFPENTQTVSRSRHFSGPSLSQSRLQAKPVRNMDTPRENNYSQEENVANHASYVTQSSQSPTPFSDYSTGVFAASSATHTSINSFQAATQGTSNMENVRNQSRRNMAPQWDCATQDDSLSPVAMASSAQKRPASVNEQSRRGQAVWKKTKVRQQKTQQRAFVFKKDNPFSLYKHDPNDAEGFLDMLTSSVSASTPSSIIPPEGIQALNRAYSDTANRFSSHAGVSPKLGVRRDRYTPLRRQRATVPEVMAQRAAELDYYSSDSRLQTHHGNYTNPPSRGTRPPEQGTWSTSQEINELIGHDTSMAGPVYEGPWHSQPSGALDPHRQYWFQTAGGGYQADGHHQTYPSDGTQHPQHSTQTAQYSAGPSFHSNAAAFSQRTVSESANRGTSQTIADPEFDAAFF